MVADVLHQDMYMYDIYTEYLNKIEYYALNSQYNSLSIRYYKQNIPLTKGVYDDLDVLITDKYSRAYEIFDFTPVLEMTPLTYSTNNDEENQGVIRKTEGTLTILAISEPLPGDIFNFYEYASTNEYFEVLDVNFVYSVKKLNIYQLTFETANFHKSSVEALNIHEHYYYLKEFKRFYSSVLYDEYTELIKNRNTKLEQLSNYYNSVKCYYDNNLPSSLSDIANSILNYLNEKVHLNNKFILDYPVLRDASGLVIELRIEQTYLPDPSYVPQPYDPNVPYDPYLGKLQDPLLKLVYELQVPYFKFINYQQPLDGILDTTGIVKQKEVFNTNPTPGDTILDLSGNTIGE